MTERVQLPFADLRALQQEADSSWSKSQSSCLAGPRELRVLAGNIDTQLKRANDLDNEHGSIVSPVTSVARKRLQSAHKVCSDQLVDRWVEDIADRARDLRCESERLPYEKRLKAIQEIRNSMFELCENHTLGEENSKYLRLARDLLQQVEDGKAGPRPRVTHSEKLVEVDFTATGESANLQLALTLCQIAHQFYADDTRAALEEYAELPESDQKEILSLARTFGSQFEDLQSDDEDTFLQASVSFSRACMARANVYADNGAGIPSEVELGVLFDEVF